MTSGHPLRIAFDATPLINGSTGVARYTAEIAAALVAAGVDIRRFALGRRTVATSVPMRRVPVPLRALHALWRWVPIPRAEWLVGGADVVHATDLLPPPTGRPLVMTVHDTAAVDAPELHPARNVELQRAQVEAARRADAVIAVSDATAAALTRYGVREDRITVVHHGVTALPTPAEERPLAAPYLLAVGGLGARKGLDTLLDAFAGALLDDTQLVLVGPPGDASEAIEGRIARDLRDRVVLPGRVSDPDLATWYAHAEALCFPTAAEGFGLPVIEAMSLGTPVIASDLPVLRELGIRGAAVLAAPGDVDAWAGALERVVGDTILRARLASEGRTVAEHFTWARAAADTAAVYESVAR